MGEDAEQSNEMATTQQYSEMQHHRDAAGMGLHVLLLGYIEQESLDIYLWGAIEACERVWKLLSRRHRVRCGCKILWGSLVLPRYTMLMLGMAAEDVTQG